MSRSTALLVLALLPCKSAVCSPEFDDRYDTWIRMTPSLGQSPQCCQLLLDNDGNPIICYDPTSTTGTDGLYYAWFDGENWAEVLLDPFQYSATGCRMVLSPEGLPSILYGYGTQGTLKYAWFDGSDWHTETVWNQKTGRKDLAMDADGTPHICFVDYNSNDVYYGVRDSDGWAFQYVGHQVTWPVSITIDPQERPHVVYDGGVNLVHAWLDVDGWHTENFGSSVYAYDLSIECDEGGVLHLAVQDDLDLLYFWSEGSGWTRETVDVMSGIRCSIAAGSDGTIHIAYDEEVNGDLRYACRTEGDWFTQVISWEGYNGGYPSICLDALNRPHMLQSRLSNPAELIWWGEYVSAQDEAFSPVVSGAALAVSPNPSRSDPVVFVNTAREGEYSLAVFDLSGRAVASIFSGVLSPGEHTFFPNLSGLPDGAYHLVFTGENIGMTESMVLLH